jgi:hypothetical protein
MPFSDQFGHRGVVVGVVEEGVPNVGDSVED